MKDFDPFTSSFWISMGVAIACGAIVGFERQMRGKPAGVRTSILICLGTAVFLGAGVMFSREGTVVGVTTAAVVWVLAAIGAAIGFGLYSGAFALALVTVVVLVGIDLLESSRLWAMRGMHDRRNSDD